ncbi:MAG: serine/threonine-protein kinase [Gemmataceae bacterium]
MLVGKDLGRLHIERELGSGAMGSVYAAIDRETGKLRALKMISPALLANETAVRRFQREANILDQLKHPNIVRYYGIGKYQKTPFFIMEYVDGESLDKILARRGPFPWEEVVAIGRQLCDALQHAHQKGIIHRDLKPSNIMVLKDGTVKLTDFGIAKDTDVTGLTGANCTVGTASYMSPEQCKGEKNLTHKSDLYSMGVMFYELLTGQKPFKAESPVEMFLAHVNAPFERPSRAALSIPIWLDTLVCQLMEKKPEHRPFDAAMVGKVLEEVQEKADALRSAGVDAATARVIDRPGARATADQADRDAARALRSAVGKKKFRKKTVPFYEKVWFQGIGLVLLLGGALATFYVLTKPPSAESLHSLAKSDIESNDSDRAFKHLQRYIDLYGGRDDAMTRDVRTWNEKLWADLREQQLFNRFNRKMSPEDEGQRLSADALRRENDGELAEARKAWKDMEDHYRNAPDSDRAAYAWVAKRKIAEIDAIPQREAKLYAGIEDERKGTSPAPERKDGFERDAILALRYESLLDLPTARDRWAKLRDNTIKELKDRPWLLLSADKARKLKAEAVSGTEKERDYRVKKLQEWMNKANSLGPDSNPAELRQGLVICREIHDLYSNDPDPQLAAFGPLASRRHRELLIITRSLP